MASTNKTTHYNLSQYVGSDKPTYLVDYNGDMSAIDTGIYNAQAKADVNETSIGDLTQLTTTSKSSVVNAVNEVNGKANNIGNLSNLTTTANTDLVSAINEVDSEADTNTTAIGILANLETVNKTNLVGAINELKGVNDTQNTNISNNSNDILDLQNDLSKFNLSNVTNYDNTNITFNNCSWAGENIKFATDSTSSIYKLYNSLVLRTTASNISVSFNTSLRPSQNYNVDNVGYLIGYDSGAVSRTSVSFSVTTNGLVTISTDKTNIHDEIVVLRLYPCIYFNTDFGDTPQI